MKLSKGLALLEVILASILLVGLIYLVAHTTNTYRQHEKAKSLGERLAPVISEALNADYTAYADHGDKNNLVKETTACNNSSGVLDNLSPHVLEGFEGSGFSLCNATLALGDPCNSSNCDSYCSGQGGGPASDCSGTCQSTATPGCTYTCKSRYNTMTNMYSCYAALDP